MPSKLFNDEPNCYNEDVVMQKPPSYQMQTISSRLKIVDKDHYHNKNVERIPFTVGSSFLTHNVKLLQQETLKKLKTIMLSYKNENVINCRNINELRRIKYDIDTYHLESIKLNYFTLGNKHYINSASKYRLFNKPKSEQNYTNFWKQTASPEHRVKQLLNVGSAGNVEQELTTLLRLHNQLENMIKDKSNCNSKAKTTVHVEAEKPIEYATRFQNKIKNDEHYSPVIQQSEISVGGQNSYSSKTSFKKEKKRTKKHYVEQIQDVQREIIENEEEYTNRIADLKEKLKLSGDPTVLNLSDFDLQEPNKRSFAPSVYSRRKRRRRIRRYVVPELDDNITLEENENKNSASENDESISMKSFTIKKISRNKFKNACTAEERPASQPV